MQGRGREEWVKDKGWKVETEGVVPGLVSCTQAVVNIKVYGTILERAGCTEHTAHNQITNQLTRHKR